MMEMEVAIPADGLAKKAAIPEVNPAPKTDALSRPPFPDHPSRKLVQEFSCVFKLALRKGPEDLFQNPVRHGLVLGQNRAALRGEGKLHGSPIGDGFGPVNESSADQSVDGLARRSVAHGKEVGDVSYAARVGPGHELQDPKLGRSDPAFRGFQQLLFHPLVNGGGEDPDATQEVVDDSHSGSPVRASSLLPEAASRSTLTAMNIIAVK